MRLPQGHVGSARHARIRALLLLLLTSGQAVSCTIGEQVECEVARFAGDTEHPDALAETTMGEIEVWALLTGDGNALAEGNPVVIATEQVWPPGELEPTVGTKIVWRSTGLGDFSVVATDPQGEANSPLTLAPHSGSTWVRPGKEWGSVWEMREPGCWSFRVDHGQDSATLTIEVRMPGASDGWAQ